MLWSWQPDQISAPSPRTSMRQLRGSIGAWARYGKVKSTSRVLAARVNPPEASPRLNAVRPLETASSRYSSKISAVERVSALLVSQVTLRASRPCMAGHVSIPTTATPDEICTTSTTPSTFFASVASNEATFAPNRSERLTIAVNVPGLLTSNAKTHAHFAFCKEASLGQLVLI